MAPGLIHQVCTKIKFDLGKDRRGQYVLYVYVLYEMSIFPLSVHIKHAAESLN